MPVFVNRTLNLKKIKLLGFDMDHTLVPYHVREFEGLSYQMALVRLTRDFNYPPEILKLKFDFHRAIVGLVIDRRNGFLLQINRYGKVKSCRCGLKAVSFAEQNRIYENRVVDLREPGFISLDTSFAISQGVLFSQLVELKKKGLDLPDYERLQQDMDRAIDSLHADGSLKERVRRDFDRYVNPDPEAALMLERFKGAGKKLMIVTNSEYEYTRDLLNYALNPFLKNHSHWSELFELVITLADKPGFFSRGSRFLRVDPVSGAMTNHLGPVTGGIFQGGCSSRIQEDLGLSGNEILYIGDHIFGDVLSIKKNCGWRTALVIPDLEEEIQGLRRSQGIQNEIDEKMGRKEILEAELNRLDLAACRGGGINKREAENLLQQIESINALISKQIVAYQRCFNPYWGEILRAGSEESRYADQVDKYACIYMTRVSDLAHHSPKTYFRPRKRVLPHEAYAEGPPPPDQI
ncbi:MAG: HAD-IG family 5'-nucleotidase [Spirochaetales bacterium]|jgi:HAD superfamily 5'-nucleotidase-like hydrolase|nr:HAD-IG family 5'-nucleotidase [Spirochaetales bacterium]